MCEYMVQEYKFFSTAHAIHAHWRVKGTTFLQIEKDFNAFVKSPEKEMVGVGRMFFALNDRTSWDPSQLEGHLFSEDSIFYLYLPMVYTRATYRVLLIID